MGDVGLTPLTKLLHLKTILELFLVLFAAIPSALALSTLQGDEIILRHTIQCYGKSVEQTLILVNIQRKTLKR